MAGESGARPVHADTLQSDPARERIGQVETHTQNPSSAQPEILLRVERYNGGVGARAESVPRVLIQPVVLSGGNGLTHDKRQGRDPTAFLELRQPVLRL